MREASFLVEIRLDHVAHDGAPSSLRARSPSHSATTTISGLSRGANPTNQPFSFIARSEPPYSDLARSFEIRCAVPVLPQIVDPRNRGRRSGAAFIHHAVHPGHHRRDLLRTENPRGAAVPTASQSSPGAACTTRRRRPVRRWPPPSGSASPSTAPCPMATEIVSPAYHFSRCDAQFPFGRRHDAFRFVRQIDAGLLADAGHLPRIPQCASMPSLFPTV